MNIWLAAIIALFLAVLILKFVGKTIVKVIGLLVVLAGAALYIFLVFGNPEKDIKFAEVLTEYTIDDLHLAYCSDTGNRVDSLKCVCIIQPLHDDIHANYSPAEIEEMKNKRIKFAGVLFKAYQNQKEKIKQKLKENKSEGLLDEFKDDIISRKFLKKRNYE